MKRSGEKDAIPDGWQQVRLGDVASLRKGQIEPKKNDSTPYIGLEHIESSGFLIAHGKAGNLLSNKTIFHRGDTLYGKLRPNLRKVIRADFDGVCSTDILAIFGNGITDDRFLGQLLRGDLLHEHAMRGISGTKMPRTSWSHLQDFEFTYPPLAEQRAIAAVLDSIDDAIGGAEAVIAATERLRDALLHDLLTRGLPGQHAEWRDVPGLGTLPADWEVVRLGDVAEVVMGQSPPGMHCNRDSEGVPLLNGPTEYGPNHPEPAQWTTDAKKMSREGDVLFCVRGATAGKMNWADRNYAIGRGVAAIRHRSGSSFQRFLRAVVDFYLPTLLSVVTGSTFPNLSCDQITQLRVPGIPIVEQQAIAAALTEVDGAIEVEKDEAARLRLLKESTVEALLTGRVQVRSSSLH